MSGTTDGSSASIDGKAAVSAIDVSRRGFLLATAGAVALAGAAGAAGTAAAQADRPDFGGWLDGVDGGFEDARGQSEVTVMVGAEGNDGDFAFGPAGLWVDPGTTVSWEWTGRGGTHNVAAVEGAAFTSGEFVSDAGVHFEHTFEEAGVVTYQCDPHAGLGMKGAVAVGDDVPMAGDGGGSGGGSGGGGSGDGGSDGGSENGGSGDGEIHLTGGVPARFGPVGIVALAGMALAMLGTLYLTLLGVRDETHSDSPVADEE